ncbi:uncharacterized protein LOC125541140 [Triticum urartu]|uniref:uncharacterized protein LOC125541140 n=1 Tax=Triticum urartu TaxID=4572 RepID=UPI0020449274|nr:uncharacterized protein LOC125541140 [Triticum urartu]
MSLCPAVVCFVAWTHKTKTESLTSWGSSSLSSFGRRCSSPTSAPSILPKPTFAPLRDPDPETAADAAVFKYVDDDPFFLSEQPDVGAQEPDATVDAYYYYVKTADDQE